MKNNLVRRPKGFSIVGFGAIAVFGAAFLAACQPENKTTPANPSPVSQAPVTQPSPATSPVTSPSSPLASDVKPSAKVEAMVGKWNGPEGTYLNITKKGSGFEIEVKDLDAAKKYDGTAKGDIIEFTRGGKTETIKPATGVETGMKGFEKETNCLVINKGSEGYCKKQ